jgi:pyruvate formate lyase activating enzyme
MKDGITRRDFMSYAAKTCALLPLAAAAAPVAAMVSGGEAVAAPQPDKKLAGTLHEVHFYDKLADNIIQCQTCPKKCKVGDAERGFCGNKENHGGKYVTLAYGNPCSINNDPIEKKPLFHFLPGTNAFSLAAAGCNFDCKFCQNWEISQSRPEQTQNMDLPPERVVDVAKQAGSRTIAYTYSEPVVFYEYMYDCAVLGRKHGLRSVMISNGYINPKPMQELCKTLDAVKIDFKAYTENFYVKQCLGHLKPVLDTLVLLKNEKMWFEMVYLMAPTLNDNPEDIKKMTGWITKNLGPDVPLHFSRFYPMYKLKNLQPTPLDSLERALDICKRAGLHFVYLGNVPGHPSESTYCPKCGKNIIQRYGFTIQANEIVGGRCRFCKTVIPGIWS